MFLLNVVFNLTDVLQLYLHWRTSWFNSYFLCARVLDHVCGFEDERICGFSQDRSDVFDWTRQNHLTQNPKRSANTGPETDRSGTKEGEERLKYLLERFCSSVEPKLCLVLF